VSEKLFVVDPLTQPVREGARWQAGHDAATLGVVLTLDDLDSYSALVYWVKRYVDVKVDIADPECCWFGYASAHDRSGYCEEDVPLLRPREADEVEKSAHVTPSQGEDQFGRLTPKGAQCLDASLEGSRLPEGRVVIEHGVTIRYGTPDVVNAFDGEPHEEELHCQGLEDGPWHGQTLICCVVGEEPSY
jgi:hypothetical protein